MENSVNLKDGLFKQNMVFMTGMLIAPIIACAFTLQRSAVLCLVFTLVTPVSILTCRLIPRTIVYTLRVILYSVVAAVFYIPSMLLAQAIFGMELIDSVGVYLPIIVTNPLILSKSETRFYHEPIKRMIPDVLIFVFGFDAACVITGILRELLSDGKIAGIEFDIPFTIPALETSFGGFLFIGIGAGLFRALYNYRKSAAEKQAESEEDEESLAEYAEDVGEFLVGGHGRQQAEKIKIYRTAVKKAKSENELLEMEFLSNKDILAAFEAIVAEGSGIAADIPAIDEEAAAEGPENSNEESADGTAPEAASDQNSDNEEKDGERV